MGVKGRRTISQQVDHGSKPIQDQSSQWLARSESSLAQSVARQLAPLKLFNSSLAGWSWLASFFFYVKKHHCF